MPNEAHLSGAAQHADEFRPLAAESPQLYHDLVGRTTLVLAPKIDVDPQVVEKGGHAEKRMNGRYERAVDPIAARKRAQARDAEVRNGASRPSAYASSSSDRYAEEPGGCRRRR